MDDKNKKKSKINIKNILEMKTDIELPKSAWISKVTKTLLKPIFKIYFNFKMTDKDKLNIEGAAIVVGNHQSYLDAMMFNQLLTYEQLDTTYFIAAASHFKGKFKSYLASRGHVVLVDANKNLKNTLQAAAKILKENKKLIMFPEGLRTRDGELKEFKKTFAILAKELEVPVIPFVINGAYESMPFGSSMPKRGSIEIRVLDKIDVKDLTVEEIIEKTRDSIADYLKK